MRFPLRRPVAAAGFALAALLAAVGPAVSGRAEVIDLLDTPPAATAFETRWISFSTRDRGHLVTGWRGNEWDQKLDIPYVWTNRRTAVVSFEVLEVRELQFLVKLVPHSTERPQSIRVLVNGEEVSRIEPQPVFLEYRFVVPARLLRRGRNLLIFRHAELGAARPHLAAAYSSILIGPNCARLRPKGRPPEPTGVRRDEHSLVVRGPAELTWRVHLPADPVLELRVAIPEEPAVIAIAIVRDGAVTDVTRVRVAPGLFDRSGERTLEIELPTSNGEEMDLRVGVYPDPCRSASATARILHAEIRGGNH